MSISQRRKGATGEREVCSLIAENWGVKAERNLDQYRSGGGDITVSPFRFEVKRRTRIGNVYDWMLQAMAACGSGETPVVACRGDGRKWLVILTLDDFFRIGRDELQD